MMSQNPIGGLSFRIAAVLICITCIFYTTVMTSVNKKRLRGRLFLVLLILTILDCFLGIISDLVATSNACMEVKLKVTYVCKFLYYLTHMAFPPILSIYIMMVCDVFHILNRKALFVFLLPSIFLEIAVLSNPFTEIIFARADGVYYTRGYGVYIAYAIGFLYVLFCLFLLVRYWLSMNQIQKVAMFYFMTLAFTGTFVQMLFPSIVCELLGESLGLMGVMIMIEKDDYRKDYRTRANNRAALVHDLKTYIEYKRHFYIICVRIENADIYRRLVGNDAYDRILYQGAEYLMALDYRYETYRTTGGNYFVLCPEATKADMDRILDRVRMRIENGLHPYEGLTPVSVKVLCAKCPEQLQDVDDIMLLADTELEENDKLILRDDDLGFLLRKVEVEKAIVRGLNGDSFKVMYQPVYVKDTEQITSGEALLTLDDKYLGEIEFSEFMKVSDETGVIEELEIWMVESVCKFIKNEIDRKNLNINVIIIHIMSVQVLKADLIEKVRKCIEKYEIKSERLIFAISDTIAMQAQEVVKKVIDEFEEIGVRFALSNHSDGIVGLDADLVDRFAGVSINVSKHFDNEDSNQTDIILQNRISMLRQLGKMVIVGGIDTERHYKMIKEMPVDMIYGRYLARKVSKEELVERAGTRID